MNEKKLTFCTSFIVVDSVVYIVSQSTPINVRLVNKENSNTYFNWALITAIRELSPEYIFEVYGLTREYWCIKDGQLHVIWYTVESLKSRRVEMKTIGIEDFITCHFDNNIEDLALFTRRVDSTLDLPKPKKKRKNWHFWEHFIGYPSDPK